MTIRVKPLKYIITGFKPRIGQVLTVSAYFIPKTYKVVSYASEKYNLYRAMVTPTYTTEEAVKSLLEDQ